MTVAARLTPSSRMEPLDRNPTDSVRVMVVVEATSTAPDSTVMSESHDEAWDELLTGSISASDTVLFDRIATATSLGLEAVLSPISSTTVSAFVSPRAETGKLKAATTCSSEELLALPVVRRVGVLTLQVSVLGNSVVPRIDERKLLEAVGRPLAEPSDRAPVAASYALDTASGTEAAVQLFAPAVIETELCGMGVYGAVGPAVGEWVGSAVGADVTGAGVGALVGAVVGGVGTGVGASVGAVGAVVVMLNP